MSDLIEALQIFLKYGDQRHPTNCIHDVFQVAIDCSLVSEDDKKRLGELSFHEDEYGFYSTRFGSC
jgi:hypothetical protein